MSSSGKNFLDKINRDAPPFGQVAYVRAFPFGDRLTIDSYRLSNGLQVLLVVDKTAPVIAFHAWYGVGSRHEKPGKTGLSHLFEHLMFNEVEGLPPGEFDKRMEAAGADNNASTWLDFTQYQEAFPKQYLGMVLDLESRRMTKLVLRQPQLDSEKEVVKNERRYRVEDDVEGLVEETLWKTAFETHSYHWPTIGWMTDIEGFTTEDLENFYRTYYSPNNATLVLVGDLSEAKTLGLVSKLYGQISPSALPVEDVMPEPPQKEEKRVALLLPTPTQKLVVGYKGPALGDADHASVSLLMEILTGGSASRLWRRLVRNEQVAADVSGHVGPHRDPSLIEFSLAARSGISAERLLKVLDEEISLIRAQPVAVSEIERAVARTELGLVGGMETADGKASVIGFYQTVLGRPNAVFERLADLSRLSQGDVLRAARRYLSVESRTVILVRPSAEQSERKKELAV